MKGKVWYIQGKDGLISEGGINKTAYSKNCRIK
jgi:hypothetical protein